MSGPHYILLEVVTISDQPIERLEIYAGKIGEITVIHIEPQFRSDIERNNAQARVAQLLFEIFSKYRDRP